MSTWLERRNADLKVLKIFANCLLKLLSNIRSFFKIVKLIETKLFKREDLVVKMRWAFYNNTLDDIDSSPEDVEDIDFKALSRLDLIKHRYDCLNLNIYTPQEYARRGVARTVLFHTSSGYIMNQSTSKINQIFSFLILMVFPSLLKYSFILDFIAQRKIHKLIPDASSYDEMLFKMTIILGDDENEK